MSVAAVLPITSFAVTPWADRALSDEAWDLRRLFTDASEFPGSVAVGEPKRGAQEALVVACTAAQVDDWDGAGSRRVEPSTYIYADQFLRLLPSSASLPEPVPSGAVVFENYLRAAPVIPSELPQHVSSFLTRVTIRDPGTDISAHVAQALEESIRGQQLAVIFDIDAYKQRELSVPGLLL